MFVLGGVSQVFLRERIHSLKLTAKAPENGWLEDDFPYGRAPIFRCYVSFREGSHRRTLHDLTSNMHFFFIFALDQVQQYLPSPSPKKFCQTFRVMWSFFRLTCPWFLPLKTVASCVPQVLH